MRFVLFIVYKDVGTIEKFSNVSTDVVQNIEFATWVHVVKICRIQHKVVIDDELLTCSDCLFDFITGQASSRRFFVSF